MIRSGIYLIECARPGRTPLFYVGQAQDFAKRRRAHRNLLRNGVHHNTQMQRAWAKYGEDAFDFRLIVEAAPMVLDNMEQGYLDRMVGTPGCMNVARCATAPMRGRKHRPESIALTAAKNTGKKRTPEQVAAMSLVAMGVPKSAEHIAKNAAARRGRKQSPEWIEKRIAPIRGRPKRPESIELVARRIRRPVIATDLQTGTERIYPSMRATAADGFGETCVSACCRGRFQTHKGFRWRYAAAPISSRTALPNAVSAVL